ncbi:MAG: protein phosphatase 2C domain-containing protein [Chloroflexota bacterium]
MNDSKSTPNITTKQESIDVSSDEILDTAPLDKEVNNASDDLKKLIAMNKQKKQSESAPQRAEINYVVRCELGAERNRNEDSCFVFSSSSGGTFPISPFGLFVVADGMGGHKNGHIASNIASRVTAKYILDKIYKPIITNYSSTPNLPPIQEVLEEAVKAAHAAIYDNQPETDSGTTLTLALILGRRLYVAHVGDSRLYFKADDKFEVVTKDHSLVQRLKDVGQYTEAAHQKYGSVLIRAVGQGEDIEVDTYMRLLPKNGRIMLCSDGLWGLVSDKYIEKMLEQDITIQNSVDYLYEKSMEAGGHDNITAIIVDFTL